MKMRERERWKKVRKNCTRMLLISFIKEWRGTSEKKKIPFDWPASLSRLLDASTSRRIPTYSPFFYRIYQRLAKIPIEIKFGRHAQQKPCDLHHRHLMIWTMDNIPLATCHPFEEYRFVMFCGALVKNLLSGFGRSTVEQTANRK